MPLTAEFEQAALSLPSQERARLVLRLMDSLPEDFMTAQDIQALAAAREDEIESGRVQPLTHDQVVASLKRSFKYL